MVTRSSSWARIQTANQALEQARDSVQWHGEPVGCELLNFVVRQYNASMQTVYIETSVVSFLRENPSASPESVERQLLTRGWWNIYRQWYELVTSQYVVDEARVGQPGLAQERLGYLAGLPLVPLSDEVDALADQIMSRAILPKDALVDALHIASAAVSRVDYLLTWNCSHIAHPMILPRVFRALDDFALPFPVICTPKDMLEEYGDASAN